MKITVYNKLKIKNVPNTVKETTMEMGLIVDYDIKFRYISYVV